MLTNFVEEEDVPDESSAYLDFLNSESAKLKSGVEYDDESDDEMEELEEESILESPLDSIEPYIMFRDAFLHMKDQQPQLYESLTKALTPEEQTVIGGVVEQAHINQAAQAQANALAAGLTPFQANGN